MNSTSVCFAIGFMNALACQSMAWRGSAHEVNRSPSDRFGSTQGIQAG